MKNVLWAGSFSLTRKICCFKLILSFVVVVFCFVFLHFCVFLLLFVFVCSFVFVIWGSRINP